MKKEQKKKQTGTQMCKITMCLLMMNTCTKQVTGECVNDCVCVC